jgi:hypothetical protein
MEKKQTAVEKLELMLLGMVSFDSEELRLKYKKAFEKAKEMERQQILDAFKRGTINEMNGIEELNSEQYYNETFKKD